MYLAAFNLQDIVGIILNSLRTVCSWICEIIYPLIADSYNLFVSMGRLAYIDDFAQIYNKISLVIGIFMFFRVTFWLIEMLVNPDIISDNEKKPSNLIKKVLISLILLATTPRIFKYAIDFQLIILEEHVIERIISPTNIEPELDMGNQIAADLFINFYTTNEAPETQNFDSGGCKDNPSTNAPLYRNLLQDGVLDNLNNYCLNRRYEQNGKEKDNDGSYYPYVIDFNGIFAVGCGILVFWMLIMYCISLGTRYAQMIFLQVVAPIPIMCNLAPGKDNMFTKWTKQCTTTYLDLFIRIAIINFVLLLCSMVLKDEGIFDSVVEATSKSSIWIKVFLVLGLLTFAKKAPELIQELLPQSVTKASGDFGLSLKKRTDNMLFGGAVRGAGRLATTGLAGAAVTGAVGFLGGRGAGRITGLVGGAFRGLASGTKSGNVFQNLHGGIKKQSDVNKRNIEWRKSGSTLLGRTGVRFAKAFGLEDRAETIENEIKAIDKRIKQTNENNYQRKRQIQNRKDFMDKASNLNTHVIDKIENGTFKDGTKGKQIQDKYFASQAKVNMAKNAKPVDLIGNARIELDAAQKDLKLKEDIMNSTLPGSALYKKAKADYDNAYGNLQKKQKSYEQAEKAQKAENERIEKNYANAVAEFNAVKKEVSAEYQDELINGNIDDSKAMNELKGLKNLLADTENNDNAFEGLERDFKSFSDIDEILKVLKERNNEDNELIAQDEREIRRLTDEKAEKESSKEKKSADANRNAVEKKQ